MKGVYVQFYRAVPVELQFLRDDARPKNNNCKLKEKAAPSILLVSLQFQFPSLCVGWLVLTTEAKQLKGYDQPDKSELF